MNAIVQNSTNTAVATAHESALLREHLAAKGVTDFAVTSATTLWDHSNGNVEAFAYWNRASQEAGVAYFNGNCQNRPVAHLVERDATDAEYNLALDWIEANCKYSNLEKAHGHTFVVANSRKIKKGTAVVFVEYSAGGFNSRYRSWDDAKVLVEVVESGDQHWISPNCLRDWVKGVRKITF